MAALSAVRKATPDAIAAATARIRAGELVAFPTETVYGLGADARNDHAVAAVFEVKKRPRFNPLIVHVPGLNEAARLAMFDDRARALAEKFWPGPLSLVLPRRQDSGLSLLVSAGLETVAVRVPSHATAQALLRACRCPIAAPSANPSGRVSPTTAAHVAEALGGQAGMILDGGSCSIGVESTVVDASAEPPVVLRLGGLTTEALQRLVGPLGVGDGTVRAPGMTARHYAPSIPLRCYALRPEPGEAFLAYGPEAREADLNLSASGNLREAAANLFRMMHDLDRPEFTGIAVMPVPETGLGRAINDRLRRAAAAFREDDDWSDRGPASPCILPGMEDDD